MFWIQRRPLQHKSYASRPLPRPYLTDKWFKRMLFNNGKGCVIESFEQPFDLLEFQQKAREIACPKKLFLLWEDICRRYERHEIGIYQLEEMKEIICPNLTALSSLRKIIDFIHISE